MLTVGTVLSFEKSSENVLKIAIDLVHIVSILKVNELKRNN